MIKSAFGGFLMGSIFCVIPVFIGLSLGLPWWLVAVPFIILAMGLSICLRDN
jgi:hypothetical protein